jgi:hypothetical protein
MGGTGEAEPRSPVRLGVGIALCAGSTVPGIVQYSGGTTGGAIGAGVAAVLFGAIAALIIRFVWARGDRDRAFEPSGFVLCMGIAAVVVAVLATAGRHQRSEETFDKAMAAIDQGPQACAPLRLTGLGGGLEVIQPSDSQLKAAGVDLDAMAAQAGDFGAVLDHANALVASRGSSTAFIIDIPIDLEALDSGSDPTAEIVDGMRDGAIAQGAAPQDTTIAGQPAIAFTAPTGEFVALTVFECHELVAASVQQSDVTGLTTALLLGQD